MIVQYRSLPRFQQVQVSGPGDLVISQGDRDSLTIEAEADLLPMIQSKVIDNTLRLGFADGPVAQLCDWRSAFKLRLVVKELNCLVLSGRGKVQMTDLDIDNFKCRVQGRRQLHIDQLTADGLSISLKHNAKAMISGDVETQSIQLADQSEYQANELMSDMAGIRLIDTAKAHIRVNDELTAYVGGASHLNYIGYPEVFKQGSGKLVRCRDKHQPAKRGSDHG